MLRGSRFGPHPRRRQRRGTLATTLAFAGLLLAALPAASGPPAGEEPSEEPTSKEPSDDPAIPRPTIASSVEPAVERYLREHAPCFREREEGIPCFPVTVEARDRVYSVAESIRNWKPDESPGSGAGMTTTPWGSAVGGVGFDPVCATRSALKALRGENDTYYLYRIWDTTGERVLLREKPLESGAFTMSLLGYELVDEITGECQALKAFSKARREALERRTRGPEE